MALDPPREPSAPPPPSAQAAAGADLTAPAFRRPIPPRPIERYDLPHPAVPESLDGLTILHLTDLHVRRHRPGHPAVRGLLEALAATPVDVVALTGDYMNAPGDEPAGLRMLAAMAEAWRPRLGVYGVFGNHDTARFVRAARGIRGIEWLENRAVHVEGLPLRIVGASYPEDLLGTMLGEGTAARRHAGTEGTQDSALSAHDAPSPPSLRGSVDSSLPLTLVHHPTELFAAAEFGLPIVLAGHTHGGQVRVSAGYAPHTSCELPPHLASGVLRWRGTLCCISRGLGCAFVEVRLNCPAQAPLYTLRRGPMPGSTGRREDAAAVRRVIGW